MQSPSMKVPPKRKGNAAPRASLFTQHVKPSMKVPPKRKGNASDKLSKLILKGALNESPSEKEGKSLHVLATAQDWVTLNESPSEKEGK